MKRDFKNFQLLVWETDFCDATIVNVKGLHIWDAYAKACEIYPYVRRPYSSKPRASKAIKRTINKRIRRHKFDDSPMDQRFFVEWIAKRQGVVDFD